MNGGWRAAAAADEGGMDRVGEKREERRRKKPSVV
jgi:hypothetical protein